MILGLSTRAIAESAVRSGYDVLTLDYFGDRDQKEAVENYSLRRDFHLSFSSSALLEISRQLDFESVVYISNLENYPDVVDDLAQGHILLGNTSQALREVRQWLVLRSFCHREGIPFPSTFFANESLPEERRYWLRKPVRSGGGHGISFWRGERLGEEGYLLQKYIEGIDCSATFVADGRDCVLLGVTEQLVGQEEVGAGGFTWCGNILPLAIPPHELSIVLDAVEDIAAKLTRGFRLKGVNGFDCVLARREGRLIPYLVEVNPRYTASMELVEWAYDLNIFDLHVRSLEGDLPSFSLSERLRQDRFYGKGIVYARRNVVMPETAGWKARGRADIPFPGEQIMARGPICTVFAQGESRDECWRHLLTEADAVRQEIGEGR